MKLSKSTLVQYLIIGALIILQFFFLDPYIKEKYFYSDVDAFKNESWVYSFILPSIFAVIIIVIGFKRKILNRTFLFGTSILFLFIAFFSKRLTDDILLYFNSKIKVEEINKDYVVLRNDENKVFHIYDKKSEFISFDDQLNKIDSLRIKSNLKSLYKLENYDTLQVHYKIGFLKVKYLE